ncbi:hypothetical protein ES703_82452 [subsurface metagenome]
MYIRSNAHIPQNWKNIRSTSDINILDDMPKKPYKEQR